MKSTAVTILVVGQTPPPFGGQAIMTDILLQGRYHGVKLDHLRLAFSSELGDMGRFQTHKVWHLIVTIARVVAYQVSRRTPILYYCPGGAHRIPMYRDLALLICTRWMFRKTIFHFHAAGVSELYEDLPRAAKALFRLAYYAPDAAVLTSDLNPPDGRRLRARKDYVVPNGIADVTSGSLRDRHKAGPPRILSVGVITRSKGIFILIEACRLLADRDVAFAVDVVGPFASSEFEQEVRHRVAEAGLEDRFAFHGVLTGTAKWRVFEAASLLCYPSFWEAESFGLVMVEAMQWSLPVVASRWRGIPSVVEDGTTGFLVPVRDAHMTADRLQWLLEHPGEAERMGARGREVFLARYGLEHFYRNMEAVFLDVAAS